MEVAGTDERKRVLVVTPGNLRQSHLYVRGHYDFFPPDCVGPARRSKAGTTGEVEVYLDGLNELIKTDIGTDAKTNKPRAFLRGRTWVRRFFEHHKVAVGDRLTLERVGERRYRLLVGSVNGNHRKPTAAEFFAGIGLVRLALERQEWQVVFANDIDADKAKMYRQNWPKDDHLVIEDIHKLQASEIPTCDLFTASFPCNDLSIAGRWEGLNGKQSSAFWGFVRILREMGERRPPLVLLENVLGFLMSRGGRDLEQALLALNELGYAVDALILNASRWVPQSRARLFVIGKRRTSLERRASALVSDARPRQLVEFIALHRKINWDLRDMPQLPRSSNTLAHIVEDLPDDDPHWWDRKRAEYFFTQLSQRHAGEASRMIAAKLFTYATAFRRVRKGRSMAELRTDGIAGCLRTPRGGSGRQILFKAGKGRYQVRLVTARECARLQGVPDTYIINAPLNQALFGFGDAVCVPAIEWILEHHIMPITEKLNGNAEFACR